jgi:hypothetical protein
LFLLGGCAALGLAFSRELGPAGEEEEGRETSPFGVNRVVLKIVAFLAGLYALLVRR